MKIAINAINAKSFGITNYTLKLINALIETNSNVEITLFTCSDVSDRFKSVHPKCHVKILPTSSTLVKTLYMNFILPFLILPYTYVHSVANLGMLFSFKKQIVTIHDAYEVKSPERFSFKKRLYMRSVIFLSSIFAKKIITVSENTRKDVTENYPVSSQKVTTIYSGCNFPVLSLDDVNTEKEDYLLFVGTIEPGKNLIALLMALELAGKKTPIKLKVVGAKQWRQSEEICKHFTDSVDFLERISDEELVALYQNAKCLVFPSLYEGFGFPVVEAMANGCPVIAADNSAIPEAGGSAAIYFDALNHVELAGKIQHLLELDAVAYEDLLKKGLVQAQKFNWGVTAERVFEVYKA